MDYFFSLKLGVKLLFCLLFLSLSQRSCLQASLIADYVVVGVGTAGAVVVNKLSENRESSVIALHSGKNDNNDPLIKYSKNAVITVPSAMFGPPFFENGQTIPQPDADNREMLWVLALPEGGASAVNAGAYCRGTNQVYSQWEAIAGPEWSVRRILHTYKKLEKYKGYTTNARFRGAKGPLHVRQNPDPSKVAITFSKATVEATGFPLVHDYNDPLTPIGVSPQFQYTQKGKNGRLRVSSGTAFLGNAVVYPDGRGFDGRRLLILYESQALRTIWDGNRAIGVEYLKDGVTRQVYARKGVVVCAGLFSSPFLLHSGVGPKALLDSFDIPVIFDNPNVGQGLADQPHVIIAFASNPDDIDENSTGLFDQFSWLPAPGGDPNIREIRFATITRVPGITLAFVDLCQTKSRGSVSIGSANPLDPPIINEGALTNSADLDLYVSAFQVYIKAINNAVHAIDPLYELVFPDPAILDDPALIADFVKAEIDPNQHFQSHCRMAPFDQGGVVDSNGKVYGVENLYVADNSIAPLLMDGSPMATGYLIGANVARLIIKKNRIKPPFR